MQRYNFIFKFVVKSWCLVILFLVLSLNARCIATPQHEKKTTDATAVPLNSSQKNYTTLIWGRLLCDATIKSYRVNKCTQQHASLTHQHGLKKKYWSYRNATGTAEQLVKTTQLWYEADSCATSVSNIMAICPFWSGGSVTHVYDLMPGLSLARSHTLTRRRLELSIIQPTTSPLSSRKLSILTSLKAIFLWGSYLITMLSVSCTGRGILFIVLLHQNATLQSQDITVPSNKGLKH